jgi:hypothetical protein
MVKEKMTVWDISSYILRHIEFHIYLLKVYKIK